MFPSPDYKKIADKIVSLKERVGNSFFEESIGKGMTSEITRVGVLPPSDVRTHKQRWRWVPNDPYRYRDVAWTETVKSRLKSWD